MINRALDIPTTKRHAILGVVGAILVALFGATPTAWAAAATELGHPQVVHIATLPSEVRLRRRRRGASARALARQGGRRGAVLRKTIRVWREKLKTRLVSHCWFARGPPERRFPQMSRRGGHSLPRLGPGAAFSVPSPARNLPIQEGSDEDNHRPPDNARARQQATPRSAAARPAPEGAAARSPSRGRAPSHGSTCGGHPP
jgi:hypothetical protein